MYSFIFKGSANGNDFFTLFSELKDPRTTYRGNLKHQLVEILFLAVTATLSGVNHCKHIKLFGNANLEWYRSYFPFENGIPSDVTLGRVFSSLDTEMFNELFVRWVKGLGIIGKKPLIAVDGKRLRGSYDKASNRPALHLVSAFAAESGISITQKGCSSKSNEITTIPDILKQIDKGCIITIDAMGCQKKIAEKIIENESDYILAVKQNQDELHRQTTKMFEIHAPDSVDETIDSGHGRIETRKCTVVNNLDFMDVAEDWIGLKSLIKVESERTIKITGKTETNTRFYISSLNESAKTFNCHIRNHWAIENNLHWVLDEVFNEDKSRRRKGNVAENFSIIAKIALTLLKKEKHNGLSLYAMRSMAGWDISYRESLLNFE